MNGTIAAMLIVFCTNEFSTCELLDGNIPTYSNTNACEENLIPSLQNVTSKGQQIFGKCVQLESNLLKSDYTVHWNVTNDGIFIVDIRDDDNLKGTVVPLKRRIMKSI